MGRVVHGQRPRAVLRLPVGRATYAHPGFRSDHQHGVAGGPRRDPAPRRVLRAPGGRGPGDRLDDPTFLASVLERIPIGRVASTADVAAAVIYLASPGAAMVTGTVLTVDGGWAGP